MTGERIGDAHRTLFAEIARLRGARDPDAVAEQVLGDVANMRPSGASARQVVERIRQLSARPVMDFCRHLAALGMLSTAGVCASVLSWPWGIAAITVAAVAFCMLWSRP